MLENSIAMCRFDKTLNVNECGLQWNLLSRLRDIVKHCHAKWSTSSKTDVNSLKLL